MNSDIQISKERKVVYVSDANLRKECDRIPQVKYRASVVHELISAYGLLEHMTVVPPRRATEEEVNSFHSKLYIQFLQDVNNSDDLEQHDDDQLEFGFGYDCPLLHGIYDVVTAIGGSSITGAEALINSGAKVAINWCGGWHHAQRDEAEGFCYVNDIVIAILKLREKYERVLYIDLDLHHGNGVENAFACTSKVFTLSFHHYGPGFYPGTGCLSDVGYGNGKYYSMNVPLKEGISNNNYCKIFESIAPKVMKAFQPNAVVIQCGADGINGDPLGATFNLTEQALGFCTKEILNWRLPSLFLGGGGYNIPNTARCWTYLTSIILEKNIPTSIPDNKFFLKYGPDFDLNITSSYRSDKNTEAYLDEIIQVASDNIKLIEETQSL